MKKPFFHRRARRCLLAILLILIGGCFCLYHWNASASAKSDWEIPDFEIGPIETVFLPRNGEDLRFRLPRTAKRVKITSYLNFKPGYGKSPERVPYRLHYELLTIGGELLESKYINKFTIPSLYVYPDDPETIVPLAAFSESPSIPSSPRTFFVDLEDRQGKREIRISADCNHEAVESISVRVGIREYIVDRKANYMWERLPMEDRQFITRYRIHGFAGMSPREKVDLVRRHWRPLAPIGISGREFDTRELRSRLDQEGLIPYIDLRQRVYAIAPGKCASFRVHEAGSLRIQFLSAEETDRTIEVVVHEDGNPIPKVISHQLSADSDGFETKIKPGMVVLRAPVWMNFSAEIDTVPLETKPTLTKHWVIEPNQPLTYDLYGNQEIRLAVRPGEDNCEFTTRFLNLNEEEIDSETISLTRVESSFDSVVLRGERLPTSEAEHWYVTPPKGTAKLELSSSKSALISAQTRPEDLTPITRVPCDYEQTGNAPLEEGGSERIPMWFGFRPADVEILERDRNRYQFVEIYPHPPEPEELAKKTGIYQWDDFVPEGGKGLGYGLLAPRDLEGPSRQEALPALFAEVPMGENMGISIPIIQGLSPRQSLVFSRKENGEAKINLFADTVEFLQRGIANRRGEISIPRFPPDIKILTARSNDPTLRCFLNYSPPAKATMLKRYCYRIGDEAVFTVDKGEEAQLFNLKFFAEYPLATEYTLEVDIEPIEKIAPAAPNQYLRAESNTFLHRKFRVKPGEGESILLGHSDMQFDGGQSIFIPMDKNLPAGNYRVRIKPTHPASALISLTRLKWGSYDGARFFRETP